MALSLLVDCDTGIDDAIALTYLACRDDAEIAGIVSTGGNVPAATVHRNNLALSEPLGLDAPVALGADRPLVEPPMFADDTHGPGGLGHAVSPEAARAEHPRTGARLWVDLARERPGELVGLVLGPHTNLALALEIEPESPRSLRRSRT
ncbi:nucleoside hydrolase [Brachybacterium sp. GPGPB12]|uniref:nucleoside hydrolase n=1 Tax=Brachybacterium sp. GPGPB12 TaxID=3023517 RepID=UPI0031344248